MHNKGTSNRNTCILLFIKYPKEGYVKSRLAKHICGKIVVELYRNFILDILSMLNNSNIPFIILFSPPDALKKLKSWLGTKYEYVPQIGHDLGERLKNGFVYIFTKEYKNAIALASDIPDLSKEVLQEACATLGNSDVVIGPSSDGGYYLIGFKRTTFFPEIFEKIVWSTNTVFQETIERLENVKRKVHILPVCGDIDTLEDLRGFFKKCHKMSSNSSKTIMYLLQHKEILNEMDNSSGS